jgi:hypothetical protein
VNKAELQKLWDEWEADKEAHDPVESSDNYYWAGASSFRDYLEQYLEAEKAKS